MTSWRHLTPCMKMYHHSVEAILMTMTFCLPVRLFVCSLVCRQWNLLSHSLRGSTCRRAGAFCIVPDTLVIAVIEMSKRSWGSVANQGLKSRERGMGFLGGISNRYPSPKTQSLARGLRGLDSPFCPPAFLSVYHRFRPYQIEGVEERCKFPCSEIHQRVSLHCTNARSVLVL